MLKLKFLGAAMTVTGSRTLLEYNHSSYLVDCGLFQGPKEIRARNWEPHPETRNIKAVILTHAHIDHSGYIPKLVKDGFRGPIYCSAATADLCKILLPDSGYLQEEDARFANMKRYSEHSPALPLYTEQDAYAALPYFSPQELDKWIPLEKGLSFRLIRAGHILGATYAQFSYSNEHGSKILTFSGDLGNGASYLLKDPVQLTETDDLVLEATYGDRSQKRGHEMNQLRDIINKVLGRKGTLVIPAFAVGRTQELLYMIHKLESSGQIEKHKVYLDSPMAQDATELYKKYEEDLRPELTAHGSIPPLRSANFIPVSSADESMLLCMNDDPKIVISAAGMLTGGRIMHHLKAKLPGEKNGVLFVGYQVEGTKGYLLKNGLMSIRIHHEEVSVDAEIFSIDSLSAHADSDDLVNWVRGFSQKPSRVFLNHGEKNALEALQYRLRHELHLKNVTIAQPDTEY